MFPGNNFIHYYDRKDFIPYPDAIEKKFLREISEKRAKLFL